MRGPSTTTRISTDANDRLTRLAAELQRPKIEVLGDALARMEKELFLEQVAAASKEARRDPAYQADIDAWDLASGDGPGDE